MHGTHPHPYEIQIAAFFVAMIPIVLLFVVMLGAQFFDGVRRSRKPAPARPLAMLALVPPHRFLPAPD